VPRYLVVVNERYRVTYATEADSEEEAITNIVEHGLDDDQVDSEFVEMCGEEPTARLDIPEISGHETCAKCGELLGSDYEECSDDLLCYNCSCTFTLLCDGCDTRIYEAHSCDRLCDGCWHARQEDEEEEDATADVAG
jgi:hypothetical protein